VYGRGFLATPCFRAMELITILNRCHRLQGFVYQDARFSRDGKSIEVSIRPRKPCRSFCALSPDTRKACALIREPCPFLRLFSGFRRVRRERFSGCPWLWQSKGVADRPARPKPFLNAFRPGGRNPQRKPIVLPLSQYSRSCTIFRAARKETAANPREKSMVIHGMVCATRGEDSPVMARTIFTEAGIRTKLQSIHSAPEAIKVIHIRHWSSRKVPSNTDRK
jgi:hypothetical protein